MQYRKSRQEVYSIKQRVRAELCQPPAQSPAATADVWVCGPGGAGNRRSQSKQSIRAGSRQVVKRIAWIRTKRHSNREFCSSTQGTKKLKVQAMRICKCPFKYLECCHRWGVRISGAYMPFQLARTSMCALGGRKGNEAGTRVH